MIILWKNLEEIRAGLFRYHLRAEQQDRIFERFYRVDKSRSKAVGGTGLGLSIVKHAALLHRAAVAVESEPGKGSTFTISFPRG